MQVTEKWLGEIGGWQAMKTARDYVRLDAVTESSQEDNVFGGLVGQGTRKYRAVLTVKDARNVDCRCACADSQRGLICAHGIAVALYAISGAGGSKSPAGPPPVGSARGGNSGYAPSLSTSASKPTGPGALPANGVNTPGDKSAAVLDVNTVPAGKFTVYLSTDHLDQLPNGTVPIFLEFTPGGDTQDLELAEWLFTRGLKVQSMPLRIPGSDLAELFTALRDHPRVVKGLPQRGSKSNPSGISENTPLIISDLHLSSGLLRVYHTQDIHFQLEAKLITVLNVNNQRWVKGQKGDTIMLV
ncbi:MAG: SWIM zinc finger domain-containing protein, partial [Verrucomicrobium sp.]|nr:SWIM zinc finger family protein [Verrucomicrobium sp.]